MKCLTASTAAATPTPLTQTVAPIRKGFDRASASARRRVCWLGWESLKSSRGCERRDPSPRPVCPCRARRAAIRRLSAVIVERSMDPGWLSNAYLVYVEPGGMAVFVDSGAPLEPLLATVEREGLKVTHLLTTHSHGDHVAGHEELTRRFGIPVATGPVETGGLAIEALPTPGHSDD